MIADHAVMLNNGSGIDDHVTANCGIRIYNRTGHYN